MSHPVKNAPTRALAAARKPPEPSWLVRTLADKATLLRLSVIGNVALVLWILIQPHFILQQLYAPQRVIILDGAGTYSIAPLRDLAKATPLHHACAQDAALAFLLRSPTGPDRPDQLDLWFTKAGREKVDLLFKKESPEFQAKQFHQKVSIEKTSSIETGPGQYKAILTGQLIRTGVLNSRLHVETLLFELEMSMIVNPDMLSNKRYPYASWDFDITYIR